MFYLQVNKTFQAIYIRMGECEHTHTWFIEKKSGMSNHDLIFFVTDNYTCMYKSSYGSVCRLFN